MVLVVVVDDEELVGNNAGLLDGGIDPGCGNPGCPNIIGVKC